MLFSIIVPVYNNSDTLTRLYSIIRKNIESGEGAFNIVFVDDGSDDSSAGLLKGLKETDSRISIVRHEKNYGQPIAIMTGLQFATGDYSIIISADLQEADNIIGKFTSCLKQHPDADLIIGVRSPNSDYFIFRLFSTLFYKIIQFKIPAMPPGGYDTGMVSRQLAAKLVATYRKLTFIQVELIRLSLKTYLTPYHRFKSSASGIKIHSVWFKIRYFLQCIYIVYLTSKPNQSDENLLDSVKKQVL